MNLFCEEKKRERERQKKTVVIITKKKEEGNEMISYLEKKVFLISADRH